MGVCSEIHTKHINTVCGQNVEFCNLTRLTVRVGCPENGHVSVTHKKNCNTCDLHLTTYIYVARNNAAGLWPAADFPAFCRL